LLPVDRTDKLKQLGQVVTYHLGRLKAYGMIGLVFGLLGKGIYVFGMQQKLSIIIGILMIILVLLPSKLFGRYNLSKPLHKVLSKLKNRLGHELKRKTPDTFLAIGFLNGFLPCGLVYMALFGAIAMGNALQGSLYMMLFGLGTVPLMTSAIYFTDLFRGRIRGKVQRLVPIIVMVVGVFFILRGLGLGIPYLSPRPVIELASSAAVECH
jgi:sulfite exporter TauE/SafE